MNVLLSRWVFASAVSVLMLGVAGSGYFFLYNFDDQEWAKDEQKAHALFKWQNRQTARFLSLVASNSRIYKGYLTYEARYDSAERPGPTWMGEKLAIVDVGSTLGTTQIFQGISYDTARLLATPKLWDEKSGFLTVTVNGRDMTLRMENSTLIYTVLPDRQIKLVGRGSAKNFDFLKAQNLYIFAALDEYGLPVILDILIVVV
jgi:hypothetical protein